MINTTLLKTIVLILLCLSIKKSYCFPQIIKAQKKDQITNRFHVKWIGQIHSDGNLNRNKKLGHKLINFVI